MGITYKGQSLDWTYWVFEIDGREFVATNHSTPQPLNIRFKGRYRKWGNMPLVKGGGFDILSSTTTTTKPNAMGEKQGTVEWIWAGIRYKSSWVMHAGSEVVVADPEEGIPAEYDYELTFVGYVPYDGPAGGAVGTGVASPEVIKAKQEVNTGPSGSGYTPPKTVEVPSAPYGGPSGSGYVEPPAQKPVGTGVASPEVIKAKQEVNTGPSGGGEVAKIPKVVFTPSTPYGGPSGSLPADTAAGPDWVKLGLQLGAAYLLLS
jgi:hypothetical protein